MDGIEWKWTKLDECGWKWMKLDESGSNGWKWMKLDWIGSKLMEAAENGWNWMKVLLASLMQFLFKFRLKAHTNVLTFCLPANLYILHNNCCWRIVNVFPIEDECLIFTRLGSVSRLKEIFSLSQNFPKHFFGRREHIEKCNPCISYISFFVPWSITKSIPFSWG